jgi:tetratricopeptide (TPR) repeat protein
MINVDRYRYSSRKKRRPGRLIIVPVVLLLIATAGFFLLKGGTKAGLKTLFASGSGESSLAELWKNRRYDELIARCDERLVADPLDHDALAFRGFSYFYRAVGEISAEIRVPDLEEAIISLRRAQISDAVRMGPEKDYILGKAYYLKGKYYYDLCIRYLERSLEAGLASEDAYDYLGLAYTQLDRGEEGLEYFLKAVEKNPTDLLLLTTGQSFLQLKRTREAEEYLIRALNKTDDPGVEKKCRFLLGQLYFEREDYFKAEDEYKRILGLEPESADAHFFLGEIYAALGDAVKARAEWRKTLIIDPSHYGARLRYYK